MTRVIPAAALAVLALAASNVSAQLVYEPFEYGSSSVGQPFANQTGSPAYSGYVIPSSGQTWFTSATTAAGTGASVDNLVTSGSLATPSGLSPAAGNSMGNVVSDVHVANMAMTPTSFGGTGTTVYNSYAFTINDISNVVPTNTLGAFISGMGVTSYAGSQGGTPTAFGSGLEVKRDQTDPTKFNVGLRPNAPTGTVQWDTADKFTPGTPIFLVFGYTFTASITTDVQQMWVNPALGTFGAGTAPTPTLTFTGQGVTTPIKTLFFNRGANNAAEPKSMQFDEIRVDNTWAQVTPPTGSTFTAASSTNWSNPGTWDAGGVPNGAAKFAYLAGSASGTVNVDSPQTVGTLTFKGPGSYAISSTNSSGITLNGGTGGASAINVQAPMDPATANTPIVTSHTISVPITLANNLEVNVALSQTLTMSGNISDPTGVATFTKNGPGTLVLSGTNSYGGMTNITSGALSINSDAALGAVPASPTLNIILTKGTGTTGILRFDADTTINPNRTIELLQNGGGGPSINTNGHNVTIAGQITAGAGGTNLNKFGSGTLTLTGDNSQTLLAGGGALNSLQINEGTLNVTRDEAIGKLGTGSNINIGGAATFQFGAQFNPTARPLVLSTGGGFVDTNGFDVTIDGGVTGSANLTKTGAGTLTLTSSTLNAATRVTGGTLVLTQSAYNGVFGATGANGVVNAGTLVLDYSGNSTPAPTVVPLLKTSHDSANFTDITQRIRTSNINNVNKGLGYYDDGVSKLTVIYTWYGDANLDGTVNGDDYALLDRAVAKGSSPAWVTGDFNYDGVINSADYLAIDTSYGKITGVLAPSFLAEREAEFGPGYVAALTAAVPEPASLAACGLAAVTLLRRRRNANAN